MLSWGEFLVKKAAPVGVGCFPLAMRRIEKTELEAFLSLVAAHGINFLDTADVYGSSLQGHGEGERALGEALRRSDLMDSFLVATKGGCVSSNRGWVPNGKAEHLRAACDASLRNLRVEQLGLYQLHMPDQEVEIEESIEALAELKERGKISAIGLCNVSLGQVKRAKRITTIETVQNIMNPLSFDPETEAMLQFCNSHNIRLIGHSPLGGCRSLCNLHSRPKLVMMAKKYGCSTFALLLAWQLSVGGSFPIPGFSSTKTFEDTMQGLGIALSDADTESLKEFD